MALEGYYKSLKDLSVGEFTAFPQLTTRLQPAEGEATLSGVFVETGRNGLAETISPVRFGGRLRQVGPA